MECAEDRVKPLDAPGRCEYAFLIALVYLLSWSLPIHPTLLIGRSYQIFLTAYLRFFISFYSRRQGRLRNDAV